MVHWKQRNEEELRPSPQDALAFEGRYWKSVIHKDCRHPGYSGRLTMGILPLPKKLAPCATQDVPFRVLAARETPDRFPQFYINVTNQLESVPFSTQLKILSLTETPVDKVTLVLCVVRPKSLGNQKCPLPLFLTSMSPLIGTHNKSSIS